MNFDIGDLVGAPAFTLGTATTTGIATVSVFGVSLLDTALSVGTLSMSWAFVLSIAALAAAAISNELTYGDVMDLPQEELYALGAGVVAVVSLEFVAGVQNVFASGDILSLVALGVASAAYVVVAYRPRMRSTFRP